MVLAWRWCGLLIPVLLAFCPDAAGLRQRSVTGGFPVGKGTQCRRTNDTNTAFGLTPPSFLYGRRESGGMECGLNHMEDLYRPIPKVLAAHPGVDGYCYFECHAPWLAYLGGEIPDYMRLGRDFVKGMRLAPGMCPDDPGEGKGKLTVIGYKGDHRWVSLNSRLDCTHMRGDDVYCHALGWLQNQRLDGSVMSNATAWRELATRECGELQRKYQFTNEEITLGRHLDEQAMIYEGPARSLALHAYHKCLLGHAAEDMAYCMSYGCLLSENGVGHGWWCD